MVDGPYLMVMILICLGVAIWSWWVHVASGGTSKKIGIKNHHEFRGSRPVLNWEKQGCVALGIGGQTSLTNGKRINMSNVTSFQISTQNAMTLKSILKCFKLASRLKVNFYTNKLVGIQVGNSNIKKYSALLNCRTMCIPFAYLKCVDKGKS
ncbi:hypothetical protein CR513_40813, partial [Mucuna pruriens]